MKNNRKLDCIIPVAGKDCLIARKNLHFIIKNINPTKIYIITKPQFFIYFQFLNKEFRNRIQLIDEDEVIENISSEITLSYLRKIYPNINSGGWYFQQFIKMGFAKTTFASDYYLAWDADTLPINKISFFDDNNSPYFTIKEEYHEPYFQTIKKLLDLDKMTKESFIAENMIFNTEIMKSLIQDIGKSDLIGNNWCEKIINSLPPELTHYIGFSEFETYGNYVLKNYPDIYKFRVLKSDREAGIKYSRLTSKRQLDKLADKIDIISLENRQNPKSIIGISSLFVKVLIKLFNNYRTKFYL